jgi:hypothetical protein
VHEEAEQPSEVKSLNYVQSPCSLVNRLEIVSPVNPVHSKLYYKMVDESQGGCYWFLQVSICCSTANMVGAQKV